jgi:hypothetical protein
VTEIELNKHHQPDGSGRTTFAPQDQAGDTVTPLTSPSTRCTTN